MAEHDQTTRESKTKRVKTKQDTKVRGHVSCKHLLSPYPLLIANNYQCHLLTMAIIKYFHYVDNCVLQQNNIY